MKDQIASILIPTDFSEHSESALKSGLAIAKRQNAEITILHVIDKLAFLEPSEVFLPDIGHMPDMLLIMEEKIKEISENIQKNSGIKTTGKVLYGQPSTIICQVAYDEKIELIVMGTHGTSGLRKFFIGSETNRVVKNAPCPVLTIPGMWKKTDFTKVLFPIRLNSGALDKYLYSRPIIEKNNSELFLLGLSEIKTADEIKELIFLAHQLKIQLSNDNIKSQIEYSPTDNLPDTIIKKAEETDSDLLIIAANIDNNFKSFFLGPFAQQVINHTHIPVLTLKPATGKTEDNDYLKRSEKWGNSINFPINEII